MKHPAILIATLVALVAPAAHAQQYGKPIPIADRLRQIDLDVAIHHYQKLQGMARETRLALALADHQGPNHPEQQQLARKLDLLESMCADTRAEIAKLGEALEQSGVALDYLRATDPAKPVLPAPVVESAPPPRVQPQVIPMAPGNFAPSAGGPGAPSAYSAPAAPAAGMPGQYSGAVPGAASAPALVPLPGTTAPPAPEPVPVPEVSAPTPPRPPAADNNLIGR